MKKMLFMFVIACFIPVIKQAQGGNPMARQIDVKTNALTTIAPTAADLQTVLEWLDTHILYTTTGLLTSNLADTIYSRLDTGNYFSTGTVQSVDYLHTRSDLVVYGDQYNQGNVVLTNRQVSLVAGAVITNSTPLTIVTTTGAALNGTNWMVLDSPGEIGRLNYLINSPTATNKIGITNSYYFTSPAVVMAPGEMMMLLSGTTTNWAGQ